MRATLLKDTLKSLVKVGRSVAIEGPPGGGKTSIVHQVAEELGLPIIEKHMPTMLVEDFGIPYPDTTGNSFSYKMPDWFPAKGKPGTERGGILCFDDRNQTSTDNQKVLANIQQARNLHGVPLADGWSVVSTGNRQSDRAGANRVLSHLRNRETVLEFETHLDDSTQWMIQHGVSPMVIAFTRFRPHLLHDFDPQRDVNPTPRSWVEGVSAIIGHVPPEAEYECFKGAIGEGAAAEFVGFVRIFRKLPNLDAVLMNPDTAEVPSDPATLYAISGGLAERATEANLERVVTYTSRMPAEFSVLSISYAVRKTPALANTAAFTRWALAHQSVLF
jgi:hypothetical protein